MIAGPLGLIADGLITLHGLPSPGTAGLATATFALGVKRASKPWKVTDRRALKKSVGEARRMSSVLESWLADKPELSRADRAKLVQCRSALDAVVLLGDRGALPAEHVQEKLDAVRNQLLKLDTTTVATPVRSRSKAPSTA